MNRNKKGQFTSMKWIKRGFLASLIIGAWMIIGHPVMVQKFETFLASNTAYTAEAANPEIVYVPDTRSVDRMKQDLVDIVWQEETGGMIPEEGEIFVTFDPNSKQYQDCIRIGGKHPKDCLSYGPMQIKLGTIQHYAPQLYGKELSDKEARDIAENLDTAKDFFLRCSIEIQGCAWNWTGATKHSAEVELLVKYIREYQN